MTSFLRILLYRSVKWLQYNFILLSYFLLIVILLLCLKSISQRGRGEEGKSVAPVFSIGLGETRTTATTDKTQEEDDAAIIVDYIRNNHLLQYNPNLPTNYSGSRKPWEEFLKKKWKQTMPKLVINRLNSKRNGFFVECGALDGVFISNSLLLERFYGWSGLLVEADPAPLSILKKRNRHAWVADVCLSPQPYPMNVTMTGHNDVVGHGYINNSLVETDRIGKNKHYYKRKFQVECYPLTMLMAAVNRTEIDYFSLDVEGVELDILKTIPFDRIRIKLISVEVRPGNKESIHTFLKTRGYVRIKEIKESTDFIHDDLYELQSD